LGPCIDRLKRNRLAAGLTLWESAPAVHATDSYGKHRLKLRDFYNNKYPELAALVSAQTPKANASGARLRESSQVTLIAGEPFHDVIGFRRCVPVYGNDARTIIPDHADVITRISLDPRPASDEPPEDLAAAGDDLLVAAVVEIKTVFLQKLGAAGHESKTALTHFLSTPNADRAGAWRRLFGARPPRGVIARIARLADVQLHDTLKPAGYATKGALLKELRRMERWYRPGRRGVRRRSGIRRTRHQSMHVRGVKSCWNKKVAAHYGRLRKKLRLEGLWKWREAAMALRQAGIKVQTGTVAVERFWFTLKDMLPTAAKDISPAWFRVLSMLVFLRHNFRHFNAGQMPTWCHKDSMLAQRIDGFIACARLWQEGEGHHLDALFDPFKV
jgi:hypothetical protein